MKKLFALILAAALLISMIGCGPVADVELEENKTQLIVGMSDGGIGTEWMERLIAAFEEKYKDYSFEEGKTGVQVVIGSKNRTTMLGETLIDIIGTSEIKDEVFFTEGAYYNQFVEKGLLYDITEAMNSPLTEFGEDKSVTQKMSKDTLDQLTMDGKLYAVPYWRSGYGMVYNATLFNQNSWYYDANGNFTDAKGNLGTGPDGKPGTYDDGLPRTYDEFFTLLERIEKDNCTPFQMAGASGDYFSWLIGQMAADVMGYEDVRLNFDFNGTATLVKEGTIDWDNMTYETEEVEITPENGYELARQPGLVHALSFAQRLMQNTKYYDPNNCLSGSFKIAQSQLEFVRNPTISTKKNVAIMLDGVWWENEAIASFRETYGSNATKYDSTMEYKWMALPKATEEMVGSESLAVNVLYSYGFIKSNIAPEKVEVATKFLQFAHTDAMLADFTETTGIFKPFEYPVNEEKLTSFSKSMKAYFDSSIAVDALSNCDLYRSAPADFWVARWLRSKYADDQLPYEIISSVLVEKNGSEYRYDAEDLYNGIVKYRKDFRWGQYSSVIG
ncbi:MAG: extracellular solute-binding protein [Oscillospiraceae bacterium]|nr:extracellular solute-binding protein [Oscillospiraceae bacterium]